MKRWAILSALFATILAVGCSGRTAVQQTGIGQTHLVLGEIAKAEEAFRAALEADPAHEEAHLGLARCLAIQGDTDGALAEYAEAANAQITGTAACFEAAALAYDRGEAGAWADRLATLDRGNAAILRAYLLRRGGDAGLALAALEEAYEPGTDVAIELAWLSTMERRFDRAVELHNALRESDPQNQSVLVMNAELNVQGVEGIDKYEDAVAEAWYAARKGDLETAKQKATPFAEGANATPWANAVLGYCALVESAPREAERLLRLAAYDRPHALVVRDMLDKVRRVGTAPRPEQPQQPSAATGETWQELWNAGRLRAMLLNESNWEPSPELSETMYVAALTAGNANLAASLAERLDADSRLKPYADAMASAVQGQPDDVLNLVRGWSPETERETVLMRNAAARAYAVAQLRARALEQILRVLAEVPENNVAFYNLATLYREATMPAHEIEAWRRLLARHPSHEEALERAYSLLVQEKRFGEARRMAEAAYVSNPGDMASLVRLADACFKSGDAAFAMAALEKAAASYPGNRMVARALARGHLVIGDADAALAALDLFPNEHDLRAYAFAMNGAWDDARTACEAGGNEPVLRAALFTLDEAYDEASFVLNAVTPTPAIEPWTAALRVRNDADADVSKLGLALGARADVLGAYALGAAFSNNGLAKTAVYAWRPVLEAIGPDSDLLVLMIGELARTGAVDEKVLAARALAERLAADPKVWIALADVYDSVEKPEGKSDALEQAAVLAVASPEVWTAIAQRAGDADQQLLLQAFENLYRLRPDDAVVQNNYAYALLQAGRTDPNPLKLAQSALETLGERSHVLHTLGLALLQAGQTEEGRQRLYQAVEQRPGDPTLMLDFGKALIAQGETEEGRRLVEAAITYADRLRVAFPRRAEAEALLAEPAA